MSCSSATRQAGDSVRRVRDAHVLDACRPARVFSRSSSRLNARLGLLGLLLLGLVCRACPGRARPWRPTRSGLPSNSCRWRRIHSSTRSDSSSTSMPFLRKISSCGLFFAAAKRVGGDVVDLLLAFLHARDVVGERHVLRPRCRSCVEAKRSSLAMRSRLAESSPTPSFSTWPNSFQNVGVLLLARSRARSSSSAEHALARSRRGSP